MTREQNSFVCCQLVFLCTNCIAALPSTPTCDCCKERTSNAPYKIKNVLREAFLPCEIAQATFAISRCARPVNSTRTDSARTSSTAYSSMDQLARQRSFLLGSPASDCSNMVTTHLGHIKNKIEHLQESNCQEESRRRSVTRTTHVVDDAANLCRHMQHMQDTIP